MTTKKNCDHDLVSKLRCSECEALVAKGRAYRDYLIRSGKKVSLREAVADMCQKEGRRVCDEVLKQLPEE